LTATGVWHCWPARISDPPQQRCFTPQTPHAPAAFAIIADDALSDTAQTGHMHLARQHLLSAMGLLANHL
jgi:hypothetical protein